jgi:hypothetical protein
MRGMDSRKALVLARHLGCRVQKRSSNGEYVVTHPLWGTHMVTMSSHRKDASRVLTTRLNQLRLNKAMKRPP